MHAMAGVVGTLFTAFFAALFVTPENFPGNLGGSAISKPTDQKADGWATTFSPASFLHVALAVSSLGTPYATPLAETVFTPPVVPFEVASVCAFEPRHRCTVYYADLSHCLWTLTYSSWVPSDEIKRAGEYQQVAASNSLTFQASTSSVNRFDQVGGRPALGFTSLSQAIEQFASSHLSSAQSRTEFARSLGRNRRLSDRDAFTAELAPQVLVSWLGGLGLALLICCFLMGPNGVQWLQDRWQQTCFSAKSWRNGVVNRYCELYTARPQWKDDESDEWDEEFRSEPSEPTMVVKVLSNLPPRQRPLAPIILPQVYVGTLDESEASEDTQADDEETPFEPRARTA